jgi:Tfp pilus assembly protein PilO
MGKLSAQMQMYIAIAVLALVTLAAALLLILPKFQEASSIDAEIVIANTSLADAQALLARRQSAKAQSAANEVELMRIANQVPDAPQLPSVIIELQDVANLSGVVLDQITPSDPVPGRANADGSPASYSAVSIPLLVHGDWREIIDYLNRLGALERGVRVTEVSVTQIPASEDTEAYVEANITLEVYVMGEVTVSATAPASPSATTTTTP